MAPYTTQIAPLADRGTAHSGANAQRDAITQALLNVQNPQPRTQMPPGVQNMGAPTVPSPSAASP